LIKLYDYVRNRLENFIRKSVIPTMVENMVIKKEHKYKIDSRKWPGVYGYNSKKRIFNGKPDVCYYISYRNADRLIWEKIGWKSEGYIPQIASEKRSYRVRKVRHGETVKTPKEIKLDKRRNNNTVNEIANAYFSSERGINLKGRKTDLNRYEKHLRPALGKRRISSIIELDIDKIKISMKNNATATVYNTLELLRRIINYGARNELCNQLLFKIKLPKRDNETTEFLEAEEAERLVSVLNKWPSQEISRMLKLAMLTGMRRGEIFKLEDRDLDFKHNLITLRDTKGGVDETIPMSKPVRELLENQILWRNKKFPRSQFIFPGVGGSQRVTSNAVKRIKKAADLPKKFRIFHGLRHHFAVTLANSGEYSLDMIGQLLTHKSNEMTKRYAKFLPGTVKSASERAAEMIQGHAADKNN
jgi:integrase